jgi:hypothetical protein
MKWRNKEKNILFNKCVLDFDFTSSSGLGGSIVSKKSKSLYPIAELYLSPIILTN